MQRARVLRLDWVPGASGARAGGIKDYGETWLPDEERPTCVRELLADLVARGEVVTTLP